MELSDLTTEQKQIVSATLRVAGFLATMLVVCAHLESADEKAETSIGLFNFYLQEFLTGGVARLAVPFFGIASGFFYFQGYAGFSSYVNKSRSRIRTILIPYVIASSLIYIFYIGLFHTAPNLVGKGLASSLHNPFYDILLHPLSVQFWFLRDLVVLCACAPLIFFLINGATKVTLTVLFGMWLLEYQPFFILAEWHLVQIETLFFFSLGAWFAHRSHQLYTIISSSAVWLSPLALCSLIFLSTRIYIDPFFDTWYKDEFSHLSLLLQKVFILSALIVFLQCSEMLRNSRIVSLAPYSFFIYLFHFRPLSSIVEKCTALVIAKEYSLYLSGPFVVAILVMIGWSLKQYAPSISALISGGRSSRPPKVNPA